MFIGGDVTRLEILVDKQLFADRGTGANMLLVVSELLNEFKVELSSIIPGTSSLLCFSPKCSEWEVFVSTTDGFTKMDVSV